MRALLDGGDRRSLAHSTVVHARLRANPAHLRWLAALTEDPDALVQMRAMDLLEKLAFEHPDWVKPFKRIFLGPLADEGQWEVRLQILRALPLFTWSPRERRRALAILTRDVRHPQRFVRAWALDSLATLADDDASKQVLRRTLKRFERSGSKALVARARKIRARLSASAKHVV